MAVETETVVVSAQGTKQGMEEASFKQDIKIRITMTSKQYQNLESGKSSWSHFLFHHFSLVSQAFVTRAKERGLTVKGPVRLPTRILRITTRKTPCGEGSKTWDRYEMRVHKRIIDLVATPEVVKQITSFKMEPNVDIEVMIVSA